MKIEIDDYMIRDLRLEDAPAIARHADNYNIWRNLRDAFPHPYKLADAENFIAMVLTQDQVTVFAIATADEAIGCIGLGMGQDVHRYSAEMGYWLAEPFWNKGIMSKVIARFTDFAFEEFEVNRIHAEPYDGNPASARALEKAGFKLEGIMRANAVKDGRVLDQLLYARVRDDL